MINFVRVIAILIDIHKYNMGKILGPLKGQISWNSWGPGYDRYQSKEIFQGTV